MSTFGDVLCLSHLRWGFVYQRPNHLMARWAKERRVFFVEEPLFDSAQPRIEVQLVAPRLHVVVPHLPVGNADPESQLRTLLDRFVLQEQIRDPLLWLYTPLAVGWSRQLHARTVVYDCMDELSHFHGAPAALKERERELFERADLVLTGGQSLYEAKRHAHPHVHAFPSSVDAAHFQKARTALVEPSDQASIPHPRVGFFGVIDERMDQDLLRHVASLRPHVHLVLIGPVVKVDPSLLPRAENIHWLGPKRYEELPDYLAGWDVAMMPFARNDATKFISPTKTLEYMAAAKPIVSTSIRDVVRPYGEAGLVRIADEPVAFARAIDAALAGPADEAARESVLAQTSWDATFARMRALVREASNGAGHATRRDHVEEVAPCSTF
jgi:glycosyltransferase involved in cell wall biosynthesis